MSGIVGIVHLDGSPVDRRLLLRMVESLAYRGPDAQKVWIEGPVGFGHAMLRTTREAEHEQQPASLDGEVWITADARVDGRRELIEKLGSRGRSELQAASDAGLILHAYHVWGEGCVEHLLGDFAFAIWDGRSRRLFCARDHFGVKPFYYAQVSESLVFSNTLDCVRLHPGISDALNELAIADFLLFDFNQEPTTTSFAQIHRLPPAHSLTWSAHNQKRTRYWTLPLDGPLRYKRPVDYVEHFREVLRLAVQDRLRTDRVGVFMSGGLDSTSVAAFAKEALAKQPEGFELRAYTEVYDRLIPHQERFYAGLAAHALGIPIEYIHVDNYTLYERWDQPELHKPEPCHYPLAAKDYDEFRRIAARTRVVLTGYGGDPALSTSTSSYLWKLLKDRRLGDLVKGLRRYLLAEGRVSRLYLRTRLRILFQRNGWRGLYPPWLNREFSARLQLPARWEQINNEPGPSHPLRPGACQLLMASFWPSLFENFDPGMTFVPVEVRHPYFDLRVVNYLLRVPPLPWCADKELVRVALRGILPERVRLRPKTPLASDPFVALLGKPAEQWVDHVEPSAELAQYVDRKAVPKVAGEEDGLKLWTNLRPLSLSFWLQHRARGDYKCNVQREEKRESKPSATPEGLAEPAADRPGR